MISHRNSIVSAYDSFTLIQTTISLNDSLFTPIFIDIYTGDINILLLAILLFFETSAPNIIYPHFLCYSSNYSLIFSCYILYNTLIFCVDYLIIRSFFCVHVVFFICRRIIITRYLREVR